MQKKKQTQKHNSTNIDILTHTPKQEHDNTKYTNAYTKTRRQKHIHTTSQTTSIQKQACTPKNKHTNPYRHTHIHTNKSRQGQIHTYKHAILTHRNTKIHTNSGKTTYTDKSEL